MNTVFKSANCISLLTDFGLEDAYVGQMKAVILSRNPTAQIIDLCHALPCQDIQAAALMLHASWSFFPAGTVHVTVVDPGVGTCRHILVALSAEQLFIAPDNGILFPLIEEQISTQIRILKNPTLFATKSSSTFHGRDIMAPAAARLASGFPFAEVGPVVEPAACVRLHLSKPLITENRIQGQILSSDHFGNLRTNIREADLQCLAPLAHLRVSICGKQLSISKTYAETQPGALLALLDSAGYLEIAVNQGKATKLLACTVGETVAVISI